MTSRFTDSRSDVSNLLANADALAADGARFEAIELLQHANREVRDAEIERRLVRLRSEAFSDLDGPSSPPWPPPVPDALADAPRPPVVDPEGLTLDTLRAGVLGHGYLHVRRLVPEARVDELVETVDRALQAYQAHAGGAAASETTPWFEPLTEKAEGTRRWHSGQAPQSVMLADSPRALYDLIDTIHEVGLGRLLAEHFGERPSLSLYKSVLRRVRPGPAHADWHQDGAFLGEDIRVVNVWLSLSHCGRDAPGLDIIPRRLDHIVETGTDGAHFDWSVGHGKAEEVSGGSIVRPLFEPGDVLLFDQYFLHRTANDPEMTNQRYAIETWFFAPSAYPADRKHVGTGFVV
jgi:Phytanoyl-CoA dioxygenase (PhyH)